MLLPVILWTDALVFLLLAILAWYGVHASRDENLRSQWGSVFRSPAAMSAAVVMIVFVAVGLLDSIHYRPALDAAGAAGLRQLPAVARRHRQDFHGPRDLSRHGASWHRLA